MGDRKETPRRSMVGVPPSLSAAARTNSKLVLKVGRTTTKRRLDEEGPEESADSTSEVEEGEDSGEEEGQGSKTCHQKKKRRKMDKSSKAKRKAERRAEADKRKKEEREKEKESAPELEEEEPVEDEEESEPVMKKASLTQYTSQQLVFDHLLRRFMEKDREEYFHFPVTPSIAPDYHMFIKKPMDLQTMRDKIEKGQYTSITSLKEDGRLIASNAMIYNSPNTVYHVAAQKFIQVVDYYTSEPYLRDCAQRLPFANTVNWEELGLNRLESGRKDVKEGPIGDDLTAEEILQSVEMKVRDRLATRLPNAPKLAFLDNKDGATVMNVIGEKEGGKARLIDLIGRLDEGTPGIFAPSDSKLIGQAPISYLNYGPYCSFAPQFDSTWATMNKKESDLLLRTYGDKVAASDALSLRAMVGDSNDDFIKIVDDLLDRLTDGEHSRTIKMLNGPVLPREESNNDITADLQDIETLSNLGVDVSFVADIRRSLSIAPLNDISSRLNATGQTLHDLHHLQHERLSAQPPISVNRAAFPSQREQQLAVHTLEQIAENVSQAQPQHIVSTGSIHDSMAMAAPGLDMEILDEFFAFD